MNKEETIKRFCKLQGLVAKHQKYEYAADCICSDNNKMFTYANQGFALDFIEQAVKEKIEKEVKK